MDVLARTKNGDVGRQALLATRTHTSNPKQLLMSRITALIYL
jgi:hypothetical protein